MERLFASALGTMDVFTVYLGDRLGLYRTLAEKRSIDRIREGGYGQGQASG